MDCSAYSLCLCVFLLIIVVLKHSVEDVSVFLSLYDYSSNVD